jgi:hypothetical protein
LSDGNSNKSSSSLLFFKSGSNFVFPWDCWGTTAAALFLRNPSSSRLLNLTEKQNLDNSQHLTAHHEYNYLCVCVCPFPDPEARVRFPALPEKKM